MDLYRFFFYFLLSVSVEVDADPLEAVVAVHKVRDHPGEGEFKDLGPNLQHFIFFILFMEPIR